MPFPSRIDPETLGAQALAVVEQHGWDSWSLRDVAHAVGVSPNALYRYVDSKEGLRVSIAQAACHLLQAELDGVAGSGEDRLVGLAQRYVAFAMARPHAFAAFVHAKPPPEDPRINTWLVLWRSLREAVAAELPESAGSATFAFWSLVHGRAELARGPARLAGPTAGLDDAVRALLRGYATLGEVPDPVPPHVS